MYVCTYVCMYLFIYVVTALTHHVYIHPVQHAHSKASNCFEALFFFFSRHFIKLSSPVQPADENGHSPMVDSAQEQLLKNINR